MAYPDEIRAQCMAALLTGQGVAFVADEFKIPKQTVSRWRRHLVKAGMGQNGTKKKGDRLGALIMMYLERALETLRDQLTVFGDPDYLKNQSASENAVLHLRCSLTRRFAFSQRSRKRRRTRARRARTQIPKEGYPS